MGQVFLTHRRDPPSCTRWPRAAPLALPNVGSACLGLSDKNGKPVLQSKTHSVRRPKCPKMPQGGQKVARDCPNVSTLTQDGPLLDPFFVLKSWLSQFQIFVPVECAERLHCVRAFGFFCVAVNSLANLSTSWHKFSQS